MSPTATITPTASPPARTCNSFAAMNFDVFAFDRYENFFTNRSALILAQAGTYTGPANIMEYVKFLSVRFGPYIEDFSYLNRSISFGGFSASSGDCLFNDYSRGIFDLSPYGSNMSIDFANYNQIQYNPGADRVSKIHVSFSTGFIEAFFTGLDTSATHGLVCSTMMGCNATWADNNYTDISECVADLATLPLHSGDGTMHFDGRDRSCRVLHAVFASTNPDHCNHISFAPLADPSGKFKCQETAGVMPSDLFTTDEVSAFDQWVNSTGMDPAVAFMILSQTAAAPPPTVSATSASLPIMSAAAGPAAVSFVTLAASLLAVFLNAIRC